MGVDWYPPLRCYRMKTTYLWWEVLLCARLSLQAWANPPSGLKERPTGDYNNRYKYHWSARCKIRGLNCQWAWSSDLFSLDLRERGKDIRSWHMHMYISFTTVTIHWATGASSVEVHLLEIKHACMHAPHCITIMHTYMHLLLFPQVSEHLWTAVGWVFHL